MRPQLTLRSVDFRSVHPKTCFGGECVPLGRFAPGVKTSLFCPPKPFFNGPNKAIILHGSEQETPLIANDRSVKVAYWIGNIGMGKTNMELDFNYTYVSRIPRMRNANLVNKNWDFGTQSISMERFNVETSYLVGIFIITSICHRMTNYPHNVGVVRVTRTLYTTHWLPL